MEVALSETPATRNLPALVEMLLVERGEMPEVPEGVDEQWRLFRALVNVRPPIPASDEFLRMQDELLSGIIESRGTTSPDGTEAVGDDGRIRLWRGDITTLATDVIVNAANSQMLGCFVPGHHCIDNAIHTFAGVQLRLECQRLMEAQGFPEPTGMAKVTEAYNLPSKRIIHTVGPIVEGEATPQARALLSNCYTACLNAAADLGCETIAFCCISTGVFGFPKEAAAGIAINAVKNWLSEEESDMIVIFNVFSPTDEALYATGLALGGRDFYCSASNC
ncbi:protein-ADP-ribose hydrolase [Adlercreutzia sp. ZJ473]|uniref:protein-ADP-ribose hydrolase n=1 Tax=Adlercreutzia sp. ZJ473 TaxID=2722822 RepID=UPI0020A64364|nr:protein-ADP-ribose hydrolase [Adlercreutzia sp. ZJ473]